MTFLWITSAARAARVGLVFSFVLGCSGKPDRPTRIERDGATGPDVSGFQCNTTESEACVGSVHYSCVPDGEFLNAVSEDCAVDGKICVDGLWCTLCRPGSVDCDGNTVVTCNEEGTAWVDTEECDVPAGFVCDNASCRNLCELAQANRSYEGCEFYAADLDNAALGVGRDASAQQFAVVVSNTSPVPVEVIIELNDAAYGQAAMPREIASQTILPGDLEVFPLPRREVDGSSARGVNDGTHSAVTSNAYRIRSNLPIIAYQFNPLSNAGVFSNDASLLLPTSAIDGKYTVVAWPQTIADDKSMNPDRDFDLSNSGEDLRAFLTIIGTQINTTVHVKLGPQTFRTVQFPPDSDTPLIPLAGGGDQFSIDVGPFDVINIETQGFNADFTGSIIEATAPVSVFVGGEASDAPRFETLGRRQCCADHLEEQLFADSSAGDRFLIARTYPRTKALNDAFTDAGDSVGEVNEPEWIRVVAVEDRITLRTTLPPPDDRPKELRVGESIIFRGDQDFLIEASGPVQVLQVQSSQNTLGIDSMYPGGDPSIVAVPPAAQFRKDYVFLTPDKYGFDFVTLMGPASATVLLDGVPVQDRLAPNGEPACYSGPADGLMRLPDDPPADEIVWRCQLSFPDVASNGDLTDGLQDDGVHRVNASEPFGLIVTGFDSYVSYGYAAGLNLEAIN